MNDIKPRTLYHFTKLESAKQILSSMKLRLGKLENANDPTENLERILYKTTDPSVFGICRRMREFRILSFSFDESNHDCANLQPMWNHYGDQWKGVCIEVDLRKFLEENCWLIKEHRIEDGKINYIRHSRVPLPEVLLGTGLDGKPSSAENTFNNWMSYENNWKNRFFSKDTSWSYEQEYRFLALEKYSEDIFMSLRNSVSRVILGLNLDIESDSCKELIELVGIDKVYRCEVWLDEICVEKICEK